MKLPREAVFNGDNVYVIDNDVLTLRKVNVLETQDDYCIVQGLDSGELLVVENLADAKEGMSVHARF